MRRKTEKNLGTYRAVLSICAVLLAISPLPAAERRWTGDAHDLQWSNTANWSGGMPPQAGDSAYIRWTVKFNCDIALPGDLTVRVDREDGSPEVHFQGVVSGPGGLTKTGRFPLYLDNDCNTFSGPVRIEANALHATSIANIGEPCALGCPMTEDDAKITISSGSFYLDNEGVFTSDRPLHMVNGEFYVNSSLTDLTMTGPISGKFYVRGVGTMHVASCLTTTLTSCARTNSGTLDLMCPTNSFTCGLTVYAGTVRVQKLADDNTVSSIGRSGAVKLGQGRYKGVGALSYYGATDAHCNREVMVYAFTNCTSGTAVKDQSGGRLVNETAGTCVTYAGPLTVNCDANYPDSMPALFLDGAGDGRIEANLPDRLIINKQGTGTWTIAGESATTNVVSVLAGRLNVDGTLTNAPCTVSSGATIGGSGKVSQLFFAAGSHIAQTPGQPLSVDSISCDGVITVDLPLDFGADVEDGEKYTLMEWKNGDLTSSNFKLGSAPSRMNIFVNQDKKQLRLEIGKTYIQSADDAIGETSFNQVGHWVLESDGTTPADRAPRQGYNYVVASHKLRTPEKYTAANNITFGTGTGTTLTLRGANSSGGNLMWKLATGQSMTVNDLVVDGYGWLNNGLDNTIACLKGRIALMPGSWLRVQAGEPNARAYVVESSISGGADTWLRTDAEITNATLSAYKYVSYTGDNSGFLGRHQISGSGEFRVTSQANLGTPPATLRTDYMKFMGTTWRISSDLTLDSPNCGITVNMPDNRAIYIDKTIGMRFLVDSSKTATLANPFYGSAPIVKDGDGTLQLTGNLASYNGTLQLRKGNLGFGSAPASLKKLECKGGTLLMDVRFVEPHARRLTVTESLSVENGKNLIVKLSGSAVPKDETLALIQAPGTTLSTLKNSGRISIQTFGGVAGTHWVDTSSGVQTLKFKASNTVTLANMMPLVVNSDIVAAVRAAAARPHPRLFADAAGFQALRTAMATNALLYRGAMRIREDAYKLVTDSEKKKPVVYQLDASGKRLLSVSRTALYRINTLAMAYRLFGDMNIHERACKELRAVCSFSDWHPSHFLDVAEMALAVAIGYDWLYDGMDDATRALVASALRRYALEASLVNEWWITAVNNWGQVCHSGIMSAALALVDEDPVGMAAYVQRAVERLPTPMAALAPNGNYPEGPGYWNYGMEYNVVGIALLESVLGSDYGLTSLPGFLESGAYQDIVTGPSGETFNYSDGGSGRSATFAEWWYAKRFNRPDVLVYRERDMYYAYRTQWWKENRLLPLALFWVEEPAAGLKPQSPLVWNAQGGTPITIQRSSWNDSTALFVGLKGGSPSGNHGHMDGGSFILDAHKIRWAVDLGSESYAPLEANPNIGGELWTMTQNSRRWNVYRLNTWSHNVPMIDGQQQLVAGSGQVTSVTTSGKTSTVTMDLSSLYSNASKVTRTGRMYANGRRYLLHDELSGVRSGKKVRWSMITKATPRIDGPCVTLQQNGKEIVLEQCGAQIGTWQAQPAKGPNSWDSENKDCTQLTFTVTAPSSGKVDMAVRFIVSKEPFMFIVK